MKPAALGYIRIAGLTSISNVLLDLLTPVTVLIGPNGSGKSNIVEALELLGRIVDGQLQDYVIRRGGFASLLHRSSVPFGSATSISIEAWEEFASTDLERGYRADLGAAPSDSAVLNESLLLRQRHERRERRGIESHHLQTSRESQLPEAVGGNDHLVAQAARQIIPILAGCRVFHFQDTSSDAPVKQRVDDADNLTLAPDARNLAPLLARLQTDKPISYGRIVRVIRSVAPFFDDFVLQPEAGRMRLRWREKKLDNVFSADELSDGTLRFICLAALLLQPERPGTVVLDEPELGLHPFAINQLAGLIRDAATDGRKVVLATQSVTLLSHFNADEVAVVERRLGGTRVNRLDPEALGDWLANYSLGELWEKNVLGGRPRPDQAVPPAESAGW